MAPAHCDILQRDIDKYFVFPEFYDDYSAVEGNDG